MHRQISIVLLSLLLCTVTVLTFVGCSDDDNSPTEPENKAPVAPFNPSPADSAMDQPIDVYLSWSCSDPDNDPLTYDVYFGTMKDPPKVGEDYSEMTFNPGELSQNQLYYWKIITKDSHDNSTTGPIWQFTTVGLILEDYLLIPEQPEVYQGSRFTARYKVNNPNDFDIDILLDARWRSEEGANGELEPITYEVVLEPGTQWIEREWNGPDDMEPGVYSFAWYFLWTDNRDITSSPYIANSFTVLEFEILEQDFSLTDNVSITMVWIPSGSFLMGAQGGEIDAFSNEYPRHKVTISHGFWLGKYEVTQAQWEAVAGYKNFSWPGLRRPADRVSYDEIMSEFLHDLDDVWRLPTEAEWEYACRAGTETRFYWGDDPDYEEIDDYAWYDINSSDQLHNVGTRYPNPWGLYDMGGNVNEWCSDWGGNYNVSPVTDPQGPLTGTRRVMRGGCYHTRRSYCRSAFRGWMDPASGFNGSGFRLVRVSD